MQHAIRAPEECKVAAIIGSKVKIYERLSDGKRAFTGETYEFSNYGQALQFAIEHDDRQRGIVNPA